MTARRRTTWGVLSLIEDPPFPESANPESVDRSISDKVPRSIALHGESTFVGRVKKAPQLMPQTQIFLPYISSSHCCFYLRGRANNGAVEAVVKDTSSNGTFVNGAKLGKRNVLVLNSEDEIALYQPQGANPLGMPIVYRLRLDEQNFAQAIEEKTEKISEKHANASATPARGKGGGAVRPAGSNRPAAAAPPNGGVAGGGADPRVGSSMASTDNAAVASTPVQRQASLGTPCGRDGNGSRVPSTVVSGAAGASTGARVGAGAPFPPSGNERGVFAVMDDQNAIRKAAEAEAQKRVQLERDGLLRQIRVQGARLEEANKSHQELLGKNNVLQEQLAEAESGGRREQERVVQLQDSERKMKVTMEEMESQRSAAVAEEAHQRARAGAIDRAAAEARAEFETAKTDLQGQVNGLVEKNVRHESRMADLVEKKLALEKEVGDLRVQVAEALGTRSGLEAQLKEARDSEQDLRARLSRQEHAYGELRQGKAEVEGQLAQRDRQLKASEESRERLEMCSDEARNLSLELRESQAALSRETQELEQTRFLMDEERVGREAAEARVAKLEAGVTELSSETQLLQKLVEEAHKEGHQAKGDVDVLREQLKQAKKAHRACEAQLLDTKNELERVKNRKEGVAVEALMRGRNLKKAQRMVQDVKKSLNEQLTILLGHLEIPGEGVVLDSQEGLEAGSELDDGPTDDDDVGVLSDVGGRAQSSARISSSGVPDTPLTADDAQADSPAPVAAEAGAESGEDGGSRVQQRLEEDEEEEEQGAEDGETEFTVPSLNFSRDAKIPEAPVPGALGEEAEIEVPTKETTQEVLAREMETAGVRGMSSPKEVGGGGRKRGREQGDDSSALAISPTHDEASGARWDRKKPKAASESTVMYDKDREIQGHPDKAGADDPAQNISDEDQGRGIVEADNCDMAENGGATDCSGVDGRRQHVADGETVSDHENHEEEGDENKEVDSTVISERCADQGSPKGVGGQNKIAIDLSQEDSEETGEDEYF